MISMNNRPHCHDDINNHQNHTVQYNLSHIISFTDFSCSNADISYLVKGVSFVYQSYGEGKPMQKILTISQYWFSL